MNMMYSFTFIMVFHFSRQYFVIFSVKDLVPIVKCVPKYFMFLDFIVNYYWQSLEIQLSLYFDLVSCDFA